jgi:MFS transporter, VNT family, synaptic vesicle glycoprotein 2
MPIASELCGDKEAGRLESMFEDVSRNSRQLFRSPILKFTLISIAINFSFHIGYYGLMMWFPELFNRFNEFSKAHPGEPATICGVTDFYVARMNANADAGGDACDDDIAGSVFLESLITVAAAVPSNIFAVLGIDRLGRKFYLGILKTTNIYFYREKIQS